MACGSKTALVSVTPKTGKLQRYVRTLHGHPAHAGRAFLDMEVVKEMQPGALAELVETFRKDPDGFQIEPEPEAA